MACGVTTCGSVAAIVTGGTSAGPLRPRISGMATAAPTSGMAKITGADVWRQRNIVRSKFGYVAQRFSLYRDLTVGENIRFFGGACGAGASVSSSTGAFGSGAGAVVVTT